MSESVKNGNNRDSKGRFLRGNSGRPKGAKDKFTSLKEEFLKAFYDEDGIGGADGIKKLLKGSARNKMVYLQMIAKMLPTNVDVEHSGKVDADLNIKVVHVRENGDNPK